MNSTPSPYKMDWQFSAATAKNEAKRRTKNMAQYSGTATFIPLKKTLGRLFDKVAQYQKLVLLSLSHKLMKLLVERKITIQTQIQIQTQTQTPKKESSSSAESPTKKMTKTVT